MTTGRFCLSVLTAYGSAYKAAYTSLYVPDSALRFSAEVGQRCKHRFLVLTCSHALPLSSRLRVAPAARRACVNQQKFFVRGVRRFQFRRGCIYQTTPIPRSLQPALQRTCAKPFARTRRAWHQQERHTASLRIERRCVCLSVCFSFSFSLSLSDVATMSAELPQAYVTSLASRAELSSVTAARFCDRNQLS